jgi:hypothetical protein
MVDTARAALETMHAAYTAAGIPACLDKRDLNPPALYIAIPTIRYNRLGPAYTAELDVYAVAPNIGRMDALDQLGALLTAARAVYGFDTAYPVDLVVPTLAADPLPAYRVPLTITIT